MQSAGARSFFAAKYPKKRADLRAAQNVQKACCGLSTSSVSRLENGATVRRQIAEAYCNWLSTAETPVSLDADFKLATVHTGFYNWARVMEGAKRIGRKVFNEFGANTVLTFPGPSAVFANLVMATALSKEQFVRVPVYTVVLADKRVHSVRGFKAINAKGFNLLVPRSLVQDDERRKRKIAVIDDSITTGRSLQQLREYFQKAGYKPQAITAASCVCFQGATVVQGEEPEIVAFSDTNPRYRFP